MAYFNEDIEINIPFILNGEEKYQGQYWVHCGEPTDYTPKYNEHGRPSSGLFWGNEWTPETETINNTYNKPSITELRQLWTSKYQNAWKVYCRNITRAGEYPKLNEQLANLFDDVKAGLFGEAAKSGKWYTSIKAIKDSNP